MKEYFSHDYRARADRKLVNIMARHGVKGIGIYWCIVEMLYEEGGSMPIECGEMAKETHEFHFQGKYYQPTGQLERYEKELIQVAAVALAMLESLYRNELK